VVELMKLHEELTNVRYGQKMDSLDVHGAGKPSSPKVGNAGTGGRFNELSSRELVTYSSSGLNENTISIPSLQIRHGNVNSAFSEGR